MRVNFHLTPVDGKRTSNVSKSALAITDEHQDLADAVIGQLKRLSTRASARATLEGGSAHPGDVWKAAAELGWLGLAIAEEMLNGELEYRRGNFDSAFAHLRRSVALDDALPYDEPWGWMQPARHALGALLLEQGHVEEAEAVYRADLKQNPDNGWSLYGLEQSLRAQGKVDQATDIKKQFDVAWRNADVQLAASSF
jgi:tetratricopeptide (TPR) repeat protein